MKVETLHKIAIILINQNIRPAELVFRLRAADFWSLINDMGMEFMAQYSQYRRSKYKRVVIMEGPTAFTSNDALNPNSAPMMKEMMVPEEFREYTMHFHGFPVKLVLDDG